MKYCEDCKHFQPSGYFETEKPQIEFARCTKREVPVSRKYKLGEFPYCTIERSTILLEHCGRDGKYWEQRGETLPPLPSDENA